MGILANSVSVCHFMVQGEIPSQDLFQWVGERLARFGFHSIDQSAEEQSIGWVALDDSRDGSFSAANSFWRDRYLVFTLRKDQRRVPTALLKSHLEQAMNDYLAANPGLSRVPKQKKEDLKEAVRMALFARTLPAPSTYDVVWDTRTAMVTFTSLSQKTIEMFEALFRKSFEGLRLVAFHPYSRAKSLLDEDLGSALQMANKAGSDAVIDLVRSNQWLGCDFMLWLMYRTLNSASEYHVSRPGPALTGEPFTAYLDNRFVLLGNNENGVQKVTVAGPQDHFNEVRSALFHQKQITEATLHLEKGENCWKLTLKGELFHFGALRSPAVTIEKDNLTDMTSEKEAVFYERMALLEESQQLFDSLFVAFLQDRLGAGWSGLEQVIRDWLAQE
jgi:hypothetical protein